MINNNPSNNTKKKVSNILFYSNSNSISMLFLSKMSRAVKVKVTLRSDLSAAINDHFSKGALPD